MDGGDEIPASVDVTGAVVYRHAGSRTTTSIPITRTNVRGGTLGNSLERAI